MTDRICPACGEGFTTDRTDKIYCSSRCRGIYHRNAYRTRKGIPSETSCEWCQKDFATTHQRKWCSDQCRYKSRYAKLRNDPDAWASYLQKLRDGRTPSERPPGGQRQHEICTLDGCEQPHRARGLCWKHYRKMRYESGDVIYNSGDYKRRARAYGVEYVPFNRLDVFKRDGWICGICSLPVARNEASLDHIIPMSLGGPHVESNSQCAHLACNISKGNRIEVAA